MRQSKDVEKFVDEIIKELPFSKYTSRFREELLEHSEDSEEELANQNINNIPEKIMHNIGDKKTLTKSYVGFHNRYCGNLWPLEFLIYIPLSILIFIIVFATVFFCTIDSPAWYMRGLSFIFSAVISFGIAYAFFKAVFWRLAPHIKREGSKIIAVILLTLVPTLYNIIVVTSAAAENALPWDTFIDLFMPLSAMSIYYLAVCIAFKIIIPRRQKNLSVPLNPYLLLVGFWLILSASIIASRQNTETLDGAWQLLGAALLPLNLATDVCLNLILGNLLSIAFPAVTTCLIIGVLVLSLLSTGVSLYVSSKKDTSAGHKRWKSACAIALISYSLYLLLPLCKINEPKMDWKVPVSKISENIERDELGIFYHLSKYINQDEGFAFHYQACTNGNIFTIVQSSEKVFLLKTETANIFAKIPPAVFSENIGANNILCEQPHNGEFADGFVCLDGNDSPYIDFAGNSLDNSSCEKLNYNGKEIFTKSNLDSSRKINNIIVTENKQWALIEIKNGFYATEEIYLVDLRGGVGMNVCFAKS